MATNGVSVNSFKAFLSEELTQGGSETEIKLSRITTLTGETIETADFAIFERGTLTIDPLSTTNIEFVSFTDVDSTNIKLTGATRGLSAKSNDSITANKKYHAVGTLVIIAFGQHNLKDLVEYVNDAVSGVLGTATDITAGSTKMSEDQSTNPRAVSTLVSEQLTPGMTLKVNPFAIAVLDSNVIFTGGNTGTMTAPVTNPRIDLVVYSTTGSALAIRTGTEAATPSEPTPADGDIVLASVFHRVGETTIRERDISPNTQGYIKRWYQPAVYNPNVIPAGTIIESAARTTPTGYLATDGSNVSRSTYAALFNAICPSQNFTVTIASPAVVTSTSHGLVVGDKIHFTTTGGFPTGIASNTDYYVISAGLTANAFQLSLAPGGSAVNTSGSQSGTHTLYKSAYGKGDGSTTFTVPDRRGRTAIGFASTATTTTLAFESSQVDTGTDLVTILNTVFPAQGQAVVLTTTGTLPTGLSLAKTYYVIRSTSTTFGFASSQANANAGTLINLTGAGSGVHTMTSTNSAYTIIGNTGGEETHGISTTELASHTHTNAPGTGAASGGGTGAKNNDGTTNATGGNIQHNNMSPFIVSKFYIKT